MQDPFAVLGVDPGAPLEEVTAGYRRRAKRLHPDRAGGDGVRRMAELNAAYDIVRSEAWQRRKAARAAAAAGAPRRAGPSPPGAWLPAAVRRALGPELVAALRPREEVELVTPVSVWASPQALLALTDRRLLWLLDDAVSGRVRTIGFDAIDSVEARLAWPLRRRAVLRVRRRNGRRALSFGDLRPETAHAIAGRIRSAAS